MFINYKKYKSLKDAYDYLVEDGKKQRAKYDGIIENLCDEHLAAIREICELKPELDKYKKLYADELQKRLELAKLIKGETKE